MPEDYPVTTEAEIVADLAVAAAQHQVLVPGDLYSVVTPADAVAKVVDLESYLPAPRRKRGSVTLHTEASFGAYVNAHKGPGTALYADPKGPVVVGVLNDHGAGDDGPGFGDHRVALKLRHTLAWDRWKERDGKLGTQTEFAELIEIGVGDIVDPDHATMMEIATSFQAKNNVVFTSALRLPSGAREFEYRDNIATSAGPSGAIAVPETFTLALQVFEEGPRYPIMARLRCRIAADRLTIGYVLDRPDDLVEHAFRVILAGDPNASAPGGIEGTTGLTAYRGVAPAALGAVAPR